MARYCAVNSLAGGFRNSTTIAEVTTSGRFNSTYVSNAIALGVAANSFFETHQFETPATGAVWGRFDYYGGIGAATGEGFKMMNGTTGVFRLQGNPVQAQYWNGSAWTNTGSTFSFSDGVLSTFVVEVDLTAGSFQCWQDGSLVASGSGWSGQGSQVTSFRLQSFRQGSGSCGSQIMGADYDLRDSHCMTAALNGDSSANTAGTGAYTDINEAILDESTAITLASAGKKGQTHASITVPTGLGISAMVINARGRVSGGAVSDGKLGIRSGGSNYSSSGRGYNGGYEPRAYIVEEDPATGAAWSQTGFNNAEIYEEAA